MISVGPFLPFATALSTRWDDMRVKHTRKPYPPTGEILGHLPAGTILDLYVALKFHRENAVIDVLYEVSDPRHPKHILSMIPLLTRVIHHLMPLQIRCPLRILAHSSSLIPSLNTTVFRPLPSQRHTAAAG